MLLILERNMLFLEVLLELFVLHVLKKSCVSVVFELLEIV